MGGSAGKLGEKELLVIGLDNSGKTTFFKQLSGMLKLTPQEIETAPTIGMNSESIKFRGVKLSVVDMGGRESSRALWAHNYASADGIIFLIDCSEPDRLGEVKKELKQMAEDPDLNPDVAVLFFANKQDVAGALKLDKLKSELNLENVIKNRMFQIQPSSTSNATGLAEGMDWLLDALKKQPKKKKKDAKKEKN